MEYPECLQIVRGRRRLSGHDAASAVRATLETLGGGGIFTRLGRGLAAALPDEIAPYLGAAPVEVGDPGGLDPGQFYRRVAVRAVVSRRPPRGAAGC